VICAADPPGLPRQHGHSTRPRSRLVRRWTLPAIGAAAAAALLLTIQPIRLGDPETCRIPGADCRLPDEREETAPGAAWDIVDAFRLARALRDGEKAGSGGRGRNGLVDDADVRHLPAGPGALRAVR